MLSAEQIVQNALDLLVVPAVYLLLALAVILFIWGVIKYMANSDNPEARDIGKKNIIWGLFGFVLMLGAWGIIQFFSNTFTEIEGEKIQKPNN